MELNLEGRSVIMNSATTDTGRACAAAFAEEGARIGLIDVDAQSGARLQRRLEDEFGADCTFVAADVSAEAEVAAAVDSMAARFGGLDIAIGAAPTTPARHSPAAQMPLSIVDGGTWDTQMSAKVRGLFLFVKQAMGHIAHSSHGAIVTLTPDVSGPGQSGRVAERTCAGAIEHMTKALSIELAERGVRANCICPQRDTASFPAAESIADQVIYLASKRAGAISGTTMTIR